MPQVTEDDISAYVDGALDPDRHLEVARASENDPDVKSTVEAYERQNAGLAALYGSLLEEPVPERLSRIVAPSNVVQLPRSGGFKARQFAMAAGFAGVTLVAGFVAGWFTSQQNRQDDALFASVVRQAVLAHQALELSEGAGEESAIGESSPRVIDISTEANPFTVALRAPESAGSTDFRPVTFSNATDATGPSTQILYQDDAGERFSLYVREHSKSTKVPFQSVSEDGFDAIYWIDGPLVYVLVGKDGEKPLVDFAKVFYASAGIQPGGGMAPAPVTPETVTPSVLAPDSSGAPDGMAAPDSMAPATQPATLMAPTEN